MSDPQPGDLYAPIDEALGAGDLPGGAATLHGLIASLVCCGTTADTLHDDVRPFNLPESASAVLIEGLFARIERELIGDEYEFTLLLPGEDRDFPERLAALAHWCRGFVLGLCRELPEQPLSAESQEAIGDFQRITELAEDAPPSEEDRESAEVQMYEVQEYVRIGVMLIHAELRAQA